MKNWLYWLLIVVLASLLLKSKAFEIKINQGHFVDEHGRVLMIHGVNFGSNTKTPSKSYGKSFYDHTKVSFVGRPVPLDEADEHLRRIKNIGFTTLRFLVPWEALEHFGPGEYDYEYIEYLVEMWKKCRAFRLKVFVDPHQDVWSRFTGGSGAPGWTLELAGFNIENLHKTGAAYIQQELENPDKMKLMIWPTNYYKLATMTMFTLFFGGREYADKTNFRFKDDGDKVEYIFDEKDGKLNIQTILQKHYIDAYSNLARVIAEQELQDTVFGFETMNEPSGGFLGVKDLRNLGDWQVKLGLMPTPAQSFKLCAGGSSNGVTYYYRTLFGFIPSPRSRTMNSKGIKCFKDGRNVWENQGLVDEEGNLKDPYYFSKETPESWMNDHIVPFTLAYADGIRKHLPDALVIMSTEVMKKPPVISQELKNHNLVYGPHYYDPVAIMYRKYYNKFNVDAVSITRKEGFKFAIGSKRIRKLIAKSTAEFVKDSNDILGNIPTLVTETGIPFDLHNRVGLESYDFRAHVDALDQTLSGLDKNMMNYIVWNYNPDNTVKDGDNWNKEDFSIVSQNRDGKHFIRAEGAVIRPYPLVTNGRLLSMSFSGSTETPQFTMSFRPNVRCNVKNVKVTGTLIFIPKFHFGELAHCRVSPRGSGEFHETELGDQWYYFCNHDVDETITLTFTRVGRNYF